MIEAILPVVATILGKILPDRAQSEAAKQKLLELAHSGELAYLEADVKIALAQADINKVEAAHRSLFVSGWRPAVGWVLVSGLAYSIVLQPLCMWLSTAMGWALPPATSVELQIGLLGSMLGLGGFRTFERVKQVIPPGK